MRNHAAAGMLASIAVFFIATVVLSAAGIAQVTWTTGFGKQFQVNVVGDDRATLYLGATYVAGNRMVDEPVRPVQGSRQVTYAYSWPENTARVIFKLWQRRVACSNCPNGYTMQGLVAATPWIDCRVGAGVR